MKMSSFGTLASKFGAAFVFALALVCNYAPAQVQLDHEPIGPSSRRTGLVISEIMYDPLVVPTATNRSLEFIEIYNANPWSENISGYSITGSVSYTFPSATMLASKAYLVVARDPSFLTNRYSITNVLGPWNGATTNRLPTTTGTVQLRNRIGAVLLSVDYQDNVPWPIGADGSGHSLVLARPSYGENDPRAWAESDHIGGSPGHEDPVTREPTDNVVLNEWLAHTDLPLRDGLELYNRSNVPVDLSGAYLSDSPTTNKFRIPNGTIIQPRGFRWYDDSVLGFSLFSEGEQIFFVNSNQTRVIDAIDFRGQSNSVSSGRWPDGGTYQYCLSARTTNAPNAAPLHFGVVINEIMYNPLSGDLDDEYVEIYNRGTTPANISAWEFINGITYTFPSNLVMPVGAHWVVARNPTNLMSLYSNLTTNNTFGPYSGTLANGGERLSLAAADYGFTLVNGQNVLIKLQVIASEVFYGDGGKWGNWSDGLGSSLELIDPDADTHLPSNWADSDTSSQSSWTAIEFNGPLSETLGPNALDSVMLMLQGVGECLVDEVEVRVDNGPNLVINGGFEDGLNGWALQGSHDFSTIQDEGFAGTKSLHVRAGSRGDNQSNRILSAPFANPINPAASTVSIRAKARWLRGQPELLVRLHGGGAEAYGALALPRRLGTPGTTNSTRIANAGPAIYEVKHAPILPAGNEPVVVTARVNDPHGIAAFTLKYRVDPATSYTSVAMVDNGAGGDAIAGDGLYSATVPGQPAGTIVAFYLEGRDTRGASNTFPTEVFPPAGLTRCWPSDAVSRELVLYFGDSIMPGELPTYHLWVTSGNSNRWATRDTMNNTPVDGTFVYNNSRVVYNALPLFSGSPWHRAQATNGPTGDNRVDYEMNFPSDDPLLGTEDFLLMNPGNPTLTEISDLSAMAEQCVYKVFEDMDLVTNRRRYIHYFVNGNQRSTTPQRPGNFIFEDSQQPSSEMINQWFPSDTGGDLYKVEDWFEFDRNGYDLMANNDADLTRRTILVDGQQTLTLTPYRYMFRKRRVGPGTSANDYTQLFRLIDAVSPAENPDSPTVDPFAFGAIADWEYWMRVFAIQRTVGNWDSYGWERGKNDYMYVFGGRFYQMTWDLDYCMGLGRPADEPLFGANDPRVVAMFNTPAIVRAYWRAFEELVNGPFRNENLDPFLDTRTEVLTSNGVNIDLSAVAAIKTYIGDRRTYLLGQLATVAAPFAVDGSLTFSTTNNLLVVNGSAPVMVRDITVNGAIYPVTWTSVTNFTLRLVLNPDVNVIDIAGRDRFGNIVSAASVELNVTYTGPVLDPSGSIIFTEIMYRAAAPGAQFIEIQNRSPIAFDLSGWRIDPLNFTFPVASIVTNGQIIVVARDKNAFQAAYGNLPLFGTFGPALSSLGTAIVLVKTNAAGAIAVDAVRYEPNAPWPVPPAGASLQLIDTDQDNSRCSNWAFDAVVHATPGARNSVAGSLPYFDPIWLNEVQTENVDGPLDNQGEHEPWIEIYSSDFVSLDGYYLATNYTENLTLWPFPSGTALGPGESLVIWADGEPAETSGTNIHTSFRLDYSGKLALVRMINGQPQITDYLTWVEPGANASYGDYPDGQPVFRYKLFDPTPAATNFARPLPVFINEFMARNTNNIQDPADGHFDDWFELYNAADFSVNLGGFFLSDNAGNPTKFQVPNNNRYIIPPHGYLLVWADNETTQNSATRADLHVSFQLTSNPGIISLYAPDRLTLIDYVSYAAQNANISEGRYTDGSSTRYTMPTPTPKTRNIIPSYNTPPRFPFLSNAVVNPGGRVDRNAFANNPDPGQHLTYSVESGPPGAAINLSGAFRWIVPASQQPGDYQIVLRVTDDGVPPRSDTATFIVTVLGSGVAPPGLTAPAIYAVSSPNGQVTFTIATLVGRAYRVLYKDDLSAPGWTELDRDFVAANPYASITDTITGTQRFYRVQLVE